MHNLCKSKSMKLIRYDYNEPQCGKDQCDREKEGAKTILRSYAGKNLLTAEEVYNGLHYGKGMKNAAVSVIKVVNQELKGEIPDLQSYHSVEFQEQEMISWRNFNIGVGQPHRYNKLSVPSSSEIILPFQDIDKLPYSSCEPKKAKRQERQLCTLFYWCIEQGL